MFEGRGLICLFLQKLHFFFFQERRQLKSLLQYKFYLTFGSLMRFLFSLFESLFNKLAFYFSERNKPLRKLNFFLLDFIWTSEQVKLILFSLGILLVAYKCSVKSSHWLKQSFRLVQIVALEFHQRFNLLMFYLNFFCLFHHG